jgi:hypothetical protein
MWEVSFKLVADAGEVGVDGFWLDMVGHEDDIEAEGVFCGIDGVVVEFAEGYVGVEHGGVVVICQSVKNTPECNRPFMDESVNRPSFPGRLPGVFGQGDHFFAAPNAS